MMHQAVNNPALGVEAGFDNFEHFIITRVVIATQRIGDKVGKLDQSRCSGIYEQRHLGDIVQVSPAMAINRKIFGQLLK